jgi:sn-glycerol 3-phosphate transport system permease protein
VLIVAFPIYYTLSLQPSRQQILRPPCAAAGPLAENYGEACSAGSAASAVVAASPSLNTTVVASRHRGGQDRHLDPLRLCHRVFPLPVPDGVLLDDFITLMLPVEVRIVPTYRVIVNLGLIDTYTGLTLPLMASATATFLFRQFFLTIPGEIVEAARVDGAGPLRFFRDILLPCRGPTSLRCS